MQAAAPVENFCPSCQAPNTIVARFCSSCGGTLHAAPSAPPTASPRAARKVCSGCSKINDAAAQFCLRCGTQLPKVAGVPTFGEPAGFWIRFLAFLIDGVVLYALGWLVEERLGMSHEAPPNILAADAFVQALPGLILSTLMALVYCTVMVGGWGATVGKMICGLRVVRGDGGRVTYGLSCTRYLAEFVSAIALGLGYLWVALSPSKRAWHDYLCDTRVVYKRPR